MITVVLKTHNQDNPDQDPVVMSKYLQKYKYLQNLQKNTDTFTVVLMTHNPDHEHGNLVMK